MRPNQMVNEVIRVLVKALERSCWQALPPVCQVVTKNNEIKHT